MRCAKYKKEVEKGELLELIGDWYYARDAFICRNCKKVFFVSDCPLYPKEKWTHPNDTASFFDTEDYEKEFGVVKNGSRTPLDLGYGIHQAKFKSK